MEKNTIIEKFLEEQHMLFLRVPIVRGLYLRMDCTELFSIECREWKNQRRTFVFEYGCGYLDSCKTETNTMEKYLMYISKAEHAEYVTL